MLLQIIGTHQPEDHNVSALPIPIVRVLLSPQAGI
jgi:hypothetical protein